MILPLTFTLKSDATFGRGTLVSGLVDSEIEYDVATGLPFLRGRTLRGMLVEECANIHYAIGTHAELERCAAYLFGQPGSTLTDKGHLRVGAATLPKQLCDAVRADIKAGRLTSSAVLESLTTVRRQSSISPDGTPEHKSLRAMRVLVREIIFSAELVFDPPSNSTDKENALSLLTACVMAWRRGGTARNRGRGRLCASLGTPTEQAQRMGHFKRWIEGELT